MLVLGIDPGTAICGYAVVEQLGNKIHAVQYGAVFTHKDEKPEMRLKKIYEEISALIDHYKPDMMSIEKLFFKQNITTGIPVGQARGVILLAAANQGLPILEFAPVEIKKSVVGTGAATKEQVTYMVQRLLNIKEKPKPDDVADALAAALCGINTASTMRWVH